MRERTQAMIPCIICNIMFEPNKMWRHSTGICSLKCRQIRHRIIKTKFKKTIKGIECEKRWRQNPTKKKIDRKYQHTKRGKKLAVIRYSRFKTLHYDRVVKENNRLFKLSWRFKKSKSNKLKPWRDWWKLHVANGCSICGSHKRLELDHKIPRINGGTDDFNNFQVLCKLCNSVKGYGKKKTSKIWELSNV